MGFRRLREFRQFYIIYPYLGVKVGRYLEKNSLSTLVFNNVPIWRSLTAKREEWRIPLGKLFNRLNYTLFPPICFGKNFSLIFEQQLMLVIKYFAETVELLEKCLIFAKKSVFANKAFVKAFYICKRKLKTTKYASKEEANSEIPDT